MALNREIALEQALIALLGAAKESGLDVDAFVNKAESLILDDSQYCIVEHPYVSGACDEIRRAALVFSY